MSVARNLFGFRSRDTARSELLESDLRNEQLMNDVRHQAGLQHHHDGTPRLLLAHCDRVSGAVDVIALRGSRHVAFVQIGPEAR
jgi:hypothetical protein